MPHTNFRNKLEEVLASADILIGGERPWDLRVHHDGFYARVLAKGSLGLGEAYMDGWWDCEKLDMFFCRVLSAELDARIKARMDVFDLVRSKLVNLQKPSKAFQIGQRHYDLGNKLFKCMLDRRLTYSCGYWKDASTLDDAQEAKLDLVCRKLGLRPGMRVLDVGCGWGGAARFAAERYGVEVVGITVSEQQADYAKESCQGLQVEIRLQDYRDLSGSFDRIFSLGMFEHVGYKNYLTFFRIIHKSLKEDGIFLLHTSGNNSSLTRNDPWMSRYIFPNSMAPSATQICASIEGLFVLEDWHNFGAHYDKTLTHWFKNFDASWDALQQDYDERFYRMWKYYLLSCAGSFRARTNQVWQIVLSKRGVPGVYQCPR